MSVSIEDTLATLITGLSAVVALNATNPAGAIPVRPYELAQQDQLPAVIVAVPDEEDQHVTLDGRGGAVSSQVLVFCTAETFDAAWALAEAIRTNGTNPGTGLAGYSGTPSGGATIQMATADKRTRGFEFFGDGADAGYFFVRQLYDIDYVETP